MTLRSDGLEALARARAGDEDEVTLLIATSLGRVADVVTDVVRLGGSVVRRHDELGYVRAVVHPDRAVELAASDAVATAAVMWTDYVMPRKKPALPMPDADPTPPWCVPPPSGTRCCRTPSTRPTRRSPIWRRQPFVPSTRRTTVVVWWSTSSRAQTRCSPG